MICAKIYFGRNDQDAPIYSGVFLAFCYFYILSFLLLTRLFGFISPEIKVNELRKKQEIQEIQLSVKRLQRRKKQKVKHRKQRAHCRIRLKNLTTVAKLLFLLNVSKPFLYNFHCPTINFDCNNK